MNYTRLKQNSFIKILSISAVWISRFWIAERKFAPYYLSFLLIMPFSLTVESAEKTITVEHDNKLEINRIKSAYLYNFLKYIEFPQSTQQRKNFFVCVLGEDPFDSALDAMSGRVAKGVQVNVKRFTNKAQVDKCHIVYISQSQHAKIEKVLNYLSTMPIVTVSDIEDFVTRGGMIGFTTGDKKIGIEINLTNARKAKVKISALLLEIANIVE